MITSSYIQGSLTMITNEYTIGLVVAQSINGVIGVDNTIPWKLSSDLKRFKEITTNSAVVMGRKTYESIGRPLPNRVNIVVTSQGDSPIERKGDKLWFIKGIYCLSHMDIKDQIINQGNKKLYAIGGHQIYKEFIPNCQELHITTVNTVINVKGAVTFPGHLLNLSDYKLTNSVVSNKEESKEDFSYIYEKLEKIQNKTWVRALPEGIFNDL